MIINDFEHEKDCTFDRSIKDMEAQHREHMKNIGWYAHVVPNDEDFPYNMNYHTHGINISFNHPDFQVCVRMNPQIIHQIVSDLIERIKKGDRFHENQIIMDAITGRNGEEMPISFKALSIQGEDYLRIIMPDTKCKVKIYEIDVDFRDQWNDYQA